MLKVICQYAGLWSRGNCENSAPILAHQSGLRIPPLVFMRTAVVLLTEAMYSQISYVSLAVPGSPCTPQNRISLQRCITSGGKYCLNLSKVICPISKSGLACGLLLWNRTHMGQAALQPLVSSMCICASSFMFQNALVLSVVI